MCWQGDTRQSERGLADCRAAIAAYFAEITDATEERELTELIVGEVLANVHRYAPGPYCAEVHWSDSAPHFSVHDSGPCFDPSGVPVTPSANWENERGRGLAIIKAIGGAIHVHRGRHGGCRVSVKIPLKSPHVFRPSPTVCPHGHPASRGEHCPRIVEITASGAENSVAND
jgi:anti-sigma regulatory factor (Ser/Thr protein kinase)